MFMSSTFDALIMYDFILSWVFFLRLILHSHVPYSIVSNEPHATQSIQSLPTIFFPYVFGYVRLCGDICTIFIPKKNFFLPFLPPNYIRVFPLSYGLIEIQ